MLSPSPDVVGMPTELDPGEEYRTVRRQMMQALGTAALRERFPKVRSLTTRLVAALRARCGAPVDVSPWLMRYSLDCLGVGALDVDFGCLQQEGGFKLMDTLHQVWG